MYRIYGNGRKYYLISTFVERIKQVKELNESEKSEYIQENALALNSYVLPAYGKLKAEVQELKGTGKMSRAAIFRTGRRIMSRLCARRPDLNEQWRRWKI